MPTGQGQHWRSCYPRPPCRPKDPKPQDPPVVPTGGGGTNQPTKPETHAVIYLIDQHELPDKFDVKNVKRDGGKEKTLKKRMAWYYQAAKLDNMNYGQIPLLIELHPLIAEVDKNPNFKWEGFMFDITGGTATVRVAIAAGAADAKDSALDGKINVLGPNGPATVTVDSVIGFSGTYTSADTPIGTVMQVRRDDQYRQLAEWNQGSPRLSWHCAYYITRDTPKQPTNYGKNNPQLGGFLDEVGDIDADVALPADQAPSGTLEDGLEANYETVMNSNVHDDVPVAPGVPAWGGNPFPLDVPVDAGDDGQPKTE